MRSGGHAVRQMELAMAAEAEFEGPDGWVQGSRWGGYMTKDELLAFFALPRPKPPA